ncbi:ATP-binding protein [Actinomadura macrotermitis]|uniref:Histidine kinase/HSP90-like ATPase domain-containing protein n=1 Tax=Actinomadura macrotermitis TaxID=2585200 RepID=A0A7K0BZ30_9ACTN|nr:ATP-binding protein [Actinomadura macrotermitis]MQY06431.1 hypothetical protein [Actinomadura macrotermitis]
MREPIMLVIENDPERLRDAREFIGKVFAEWGLDAETARLCVSELAGNAMTHTASATITVRAFLTERGPVIEVFDDSPALPVVHAFDCDSESGRGLAMLELMTVSLGWRPVAPRGKCVHALLGRAEPF